MDGAETLQLRYDDGKRAVARRQLLQFGEVMRRVYLYSVHHHVVREIDSAPVGSGDVESDKLLVVGKITLHRKQVL